MVDGTRVPTAEGHDCYQHKLIRDEVVSSLYNSLFEFVARNLFIAADKDHCIGWYRKNDLQAYRT